MGAINHIPKRTRHMTESILQVVEQNGDLVVDSRLIAARLDIEHRAFMQTLKRYQDRIEQRFGVVTFEMDKPIEGSQGGRPEKYALLTEDQATTLMTFSKNTDAVVNCKMDLVGAFSKARQIIKVVIPQQNDQLLMMQLENENLRLANENMRIQQDLLGLQNNMLCLHGAPVILALSGKSDQLVEIEKEVTIIFEPETGREDKIMTAEQLKKFVLARTGQKLHSLKWFADELRKLGRDDLLIPVTRHSTSEYPKPDFIDEAMRIVYGKERQRLIGEK